MFRTTEELASNFVDVPLSNQKFGSSMTLKFFSLCGSMKLVSIHAVITLSVRVFNLALISSFVFSSVVV